MATFKIRRIQRLKKPWQLDLRSAGKGRHCFETRKAAEQYGAIIDSERVAFGAAGLNLTDREKVEFVAAKERIGGNLIREAVDFFIAHKGLAITKSLAEAIEECISAKQAKSRSPHYIRQIKNSLAQLRESCEVETCSQVTQAHIEELLTNSEWTRATRRTKLIDIGTFFAFCLVKRYISINPTENVEAIPRDEQPPGILRPAEVRALFNAAVEHRLDFLAYLTLGIFLGIRPEEIDKLKPENIQVDRGFVEVPSAVSKTRRRRLVDIPANAVKWLKVSEVLPGVDKWRPLNRIRAEAAKALGVSKFPWSQDCMRHSFASYHLAAHGSADKTALQMGHRGTDMLFRHYREIVTREDAKEFWEIAPLAKT